MTAAPDFCLVMIVKNEAHVIERCLRSARAVGIKKFCICDTGSTDGTPEKIMRLADAIGMAGSVHEIPWENFGQARTRAYAEAHAQTGDARAEWLITTDADHEFSGTLEGFAPTETDPDVWLIQRRAANQIFWAKAIVRNDRCWRVVGVMHEVLDTGDIPCGQYGKLIEIVHHDGARSKDLHKPVRDAQLLERAIAGADLRWRLLRGLAATVAVLLPGSAVRRWLDRCSLRRLLAVVAAHQARDLFYAANCWRDARQFDRAIALYEARFAIDNWGEERWYCLYQKGICLALSGRCPVLDWLAAWEFRPHRAEPLARLADYWAQLGFWRNAMIAAELAKNIEPPQPSELLFIEPSAYSWAPLNTLAAAQANLGDAATACATIKRMLDYSNVPDDVRSAALSNLAKIDHAQS